MEPILATWRERRRNRLLRFMQEQRGIETDLARVFRMDRNTATALIAKLTPRERETVEGIAMGWTRVRIAERLGITVRTVEKHIEGAVTKLGMPPHGFARVWFCAACGEG